MKKDKHLKQLNRDIDWKPMGMLKLSMILGLFIAGWTAIYHSGRLVYNIIRDIGLF